MTISSKTKVTWQIQINANRSGQTEPDPWKTIETFDFEEDSKEFYISPKNRCYPGCLYRVVRVEETVTETVVA